VGKTIYATPNIISPPTPVTFNSDICNGCNKCVETCQMDVLIPNPVKGKPPIVLYPDECWYGGCCVAICPHQHAIKLHHPLQQQVRFKRKATGEHFRIK